MDLKTYWRTLTKEDREAFAGRCESTVGHLQNVMYRVRPAATDLAVAIERESGGLVTRQELRPEDWQRHWPELVKVTPQHGPLRRELRDGAAAAGGEWGVATMPAPGAPMEDAPAPAPAPRPLAPTGASAAPTFGARRTAVVRRREGPSGGADDAGGTPNARARS